MTKEKEIIKIETNEKGVEVLFAALSRHFYYLDEVADHAEWKEEKEIIKNFINQVVKN